jgi:hypothetical protein
VVLTLVSKGVTAVVIAVKCVEEPVVRRHTAAEPRERTCASVVAAAAATVVAVTG